MASDSRKDQQNAVWMARLGSALRTALACTIVGCTTLFGPAPVRHLLSYPSLAYVTTILIVADATLGDTIRGLFHVLCATIQVIIPSAFFLWLMGPERFTTSVAAAAVAITAFYVALPESSPLMVKRIAFGQAVTVYVGIVVHGAQTDVVMHPVHVAASTALGAFASVLAMLVPFPRLACHQVRNSCGLYVENALERLDLFVEAFTAKDKDDTSDLISQAKFLSRVGVRCLQSIQNDQEGMIWEKPQIGWGKAKRMDTGENLQEVELSIRGMEMALKSCHLFPISIVEKGFKEQIQNMKEKVGLKLLEQTKSTTATEVQGEFSDNKPLWRPPTDGRTQEGLATLFFMYCMELLQCSTPLGRSPESISQKTQSAATEEDVSDPKHQAKFRLLKAWERSREKWTFACKCSISLGFAVLFGLTFNRANGYWSGLTISISLVTGRQAIITAANARAHGTAIGSVYGILCCSIFHPVQFRFLPLLPWIVFASFLRHSRMFGQAGSISSVIAALLIMGRNNYGGNYINFAIVRLTEVCIGLTCLVLVEIILQPVRAATLARTALVSSLDSVHDCIEGLAQSAREISMASSNPFHLQERHRKLKSRVDEMERFIAEAETEPNFWFLPFHTACYSRILQSLRKMEDLLLFATRAIEILSQLEKTGKNLNALQEHLNDDVDYFEDNVGSSLRYLQELLLIKSIGALDGDLRSKSISPDIEFGRSVDASTCITFGTNEEKIMEIENSYLQHLTEIADTFNAQPDDQESSAASRMILCLGGLGFCIANLMRETAELQKQERDLITWENPTKRINLREIYCKINALHT